MVSLPTAGACTQRARQMGIDASTFVLLNRATTSGSQRRGARLDGPSRGTTRTRRSGACVAVDFGFRDFRGREGTEIVIRVRIDCRPRRLSSRRSHHAQPVPETGRKPSRPEREGFCSSRVAPRSRAQPAAAGQCPERPEGGLMREGVDQQVRSHGVRAPFARNSRYEGNTATRGCCKERNLSC
jgi:hypothetical protein